MNEQRSAATPLATLFYSYAREDEPLRDELHTHLSSLHRQGLITSWYNRQILAGADWTQDIDRHLESASIILLLISADFLASDYNFGIEMQRALERHHEGSACVIPILLRPCDWEQAPFAGLQYLPRNGLPVTKWPSHDDAFREIARDIRAVIIALLADVVPGEPRRVFLSSVPADHTFATRLAADLQEQRISVWQVERSGDLEAARTQIRAADVVLQITSPAAQSSRAVREHLRIAQLYQRPLIFIVAEGDDPLPQAEHSAQQVIDAREGRYQQALTDLLAALQRETAAEEDVLQKMPVHAEPLAEPRNPYKGLRAFTAADSGDFFGRDRLIAELIEKVGIAAGIPKGVAARFIAPTESQDIPVVRLLPIIGASGSGKSSVIMAGVLPRLHQGALPGSEHWVYLPPMTPEARPLEALAFTLVDHLPGRSFKSLLEDLEDDSARGLHLLALQLGKESQHVRARPAQNISVQDIPADRAGDAPPRVVLFIDQFEELFTLTSNEQERRQFIDLLITAINEPKGSLVVILTLRADFYDRLGANPELGQLVVQRQAIMWPMNTQDLRAVITGPAALPGVQLSFEGDLLGDLLFEMQGQPGALPLLQFTLEQLFERRDGHRLTLSAYQEIGGIKGALSRHAEHTYAALPSGEHRKQARTLFVRLIEPGATEQDTTRRRASLSEFTLDDPAETRLLRETIDAFVTARLLTTNEIAGTTTIEVSHEALIREWPRLGEWMRAAREDIPLQQAISEDVAEWERRGKPGDRLYRGAQLKEAQAWSTRNTPSAQERAFLRASVVQRQRTIVSIFAAALLILASLSTATWFVTHQQPAPPNRTLVTNLRDGDSTGSLRWAIEEAPAKSTITFDPSVRGTIVLSRDLVIGKALTIKGPGARLLTIRGSSSLQIVSIARDVAVSISGLAFQGDHKGCPQQAPDCLGLIYNEGTLSLIRSTVSGNTAAEGGGIYNSGTLTVSSSTVSGNTASLDGGGIVNNGTLTVSSSIVSDNGALKYGGGIANIGTLTVSSSTVSGNSVVSSPSPVGGGIFNDGTLTVNSSTISSNTAAEGGGIYNIGTLTVSSSTVSGNTASQGNGGGIYNDFDFTVSSSTVSGNTASLDGGGIYNYGAPAGSNSISIIVTNSTIANNKAVSGGGITISGVASTPSHSPVQATLTSCTLYHNTSTTGADISIFDQDYQGKPLPQQTSSVTLRNSIVVGTAGSDMQGRVISQGYNLFLANSGATFAATPEHATDKTVQDLSKVFVTTPAQLDKHGGPTMTLALLPDSSNPAVDAIPLDACQVDDGTGHKIKTDQRGMARPDDGESMCDIGAYES